MDMADISTRNLIAGLNTPVPLRNGRTVTAINFDNAATTPPFISVLEEIQNFSPWYASIHRGTGYKSILSSEMYEKARAVVADFVGANCDEHSVIFVKNTTEAINLVAQILPGNSRKNVILSTWMEHHSNDLPWRSQFVIDYVNIDRYGRLSLDDLKSKLAKHRRKVRLVTVAGISNVTGFINPIHEIAELAHQYGAEILVDGAQWIPHKKMNMKPLDAPDHIDYLAFSAHKMYAPFGIGVLVGPKCFFNKKVPGQSGGGTIRAVTHDHVVWADSPERNEAGTPNMMGVVSLVEAIRVLQSIGMQNIERHEAMLTRHILSRMNSIPGIEIYGSTSYSMDRTGIIPFNLMGLSHETTARELSELGGIAVRNGCFCAQPYIHKLLNLSREEIHAYIRHPERGRPGMVRVSFGLYNSIEEIDNFILVLQNLSGNSPTSAEYPHNNPANG